jgi:hypothetical protein
MKMACTSVLMVFKTGAVRPLHSGTHWVMGQVAAILVMDGTTVTSAITTPNTMVEIKDGSVIVYAPAVTENAIEKLKAKCATLRLYVNDVPSVMTYVPVVRGSRGVEADPHWKVITPELMENINYVFLTPEQAIAAIAPFVEDGQRKLVEREAEFRLWRLRCEDVMMEDYDITIHVKHGGFDFYTTFNAETE